MQRELEYVQRVRRIWLSTGWAIKMHQMLRLHSNKVEIYQNDHMSPSIGTRKWSMTRRRHRVRLSAHYLPIWGVCHKQWRTIQNFENIKDIYENSC